MFVRMLLEYTLHPCLQVDALLGRRKEGDHEATTNLKTEFMQHWDGLLPADATHHILVLGATNRPAELDAAVMRRFSLQLEVRRRHRCGATTTTKLGAPSRGAFRLCGVVGATGVQAS